MITEDLEEDQSRGPVVDPVVKEDDDGLDRLWIIVMICAGCVVLCLICIAYSCLRKAEQEDGENNDDEDDADNSQTNAKPVDAVTHDEVEDDYSGEEEEESSGNVEDPTDPSLGRFQISN